MESGLAVVCEDSGEGSTDQTGSNQQARNSYTEHTLVEENEVGHELSDNVITFTIICRACDFCCWLTFFTCLSLENER